jgi:hypothetical protein
MVIEITEYLFYFFYQKYLKVDKDIPGVYALGLITILQFLNIATVGMLLTLFNVITIDEVTNTLIIAIILLLLIANYLYIYKKRGREQILQQYSGNNTMRIRKVRKCSLLYLLITLVLFLGFFIYFLLNRHLV